MKTGKERLKKYAFGTDEEGTSKVNSGLKTGLELTGAAVGIVDAIEKMNQGFQRQPTMNRMAMRQMVTPYGNFAFGGDVDTESLLAELQMQADEMGISIEELIQQMQQGGGEEEEMMMEEDEQEEFAFGGGVGGPGNEGDNLQVIVTDEDRAMLKKDSYTRNLFGDEGEKIYGAGFRPRTYGANNELIYTTNSDQFVTQDKRKIGYKPNKIGGLNRVFIKDDGTYENADDVNMEAAQVVGDITRLYGGRLNQLLADNTVAKKTFAFGGKAGGKAIEVEDEEVLQYPNGSMVKAKGKTHEQGGIDVVVPSGTKIYSDRLAVDGMSMQERKTKRERALARIEKSLGKNPSDKINKNTYERVAKNLAIEEQEDMALQKAAKMILGQPGEAAYGDEIDPYDPFGVRDLLTLKTGGGYVPKIAGSSTTDNDPIDPDFTVKSKAPTGLGTLTPNPVTDKRIKGDKAKMDARAEMEDDDYTVGDMIGLAGTTLGAVLPLLNTMSNRAGDAPNINRFRGFGRDAIEENRKAQDAAATLKGEQMTDIQIGSNTARARNRNSASSVNTLRALDAVTDMQSGRLKQGAADSFSKTLMGLFGQKGQLENVQDQMVMQGETRRDLEDKMDRDAYYTNLAENYANIGTSVQSAGRNLNIAKSNTTDKKLLSQLSQYDLAFDDNGNLISI